MSKLSSRSPLPIIFMCIFSVLAPMADAEDFRNPELAIEQRVELLLAKMTTVEKIAQMKSLHGNRLIAANEGTQEEKDQSLTEKMRHGIGQIENIGDKRRPEESARYTNELQRILVENTRLGIPAIIASECLHGHHAFNSTSFPVPIAMAASFNTELVHKAFRVIGREARLRGSHSAHTPVLDIGRDPRWGRIEETYGEDTFLVSEMGYAAITGLQGGNNGVPGLQHIVANAKHFAGYGQVAGGRNFAPTDIPERQLRDEIMLPFEHAIKRAKGMGVMASHCDIDGIPAHASHWLLTEVLRNEWGFKGVVVTDYNDVPRLHEFQNVAETKQQAALLGLKAGVDLDIPTGQSYQYLEELLEKDPELIALIDRSVRRILTLKFKLGLFENPYADPDQAAVKVNSKATKKLAKELATESAVLLKNNGVLPLNAKKLSSIAVIGPNAKSIATGAYSSKSEFNSSVFDGLKAKFGEAIAVNYEQGCVVANIKRDKDRKRAIVEVPLEKELESIEKAVALAKRSDVAIVVIGSEPRFSQEAYYAKGHAGDRASIHILGNQLELLRRVKATGTPTVAVLMHGKPLLIGPVIEQADAVLDIFYLGQEQGHAVSDLLFGDANPSGKLAVSYPRSVGQLPIYYSQKRTAFFKDYLDLDATPLFAFGYGLSYSQFSYNTLDVPQTTIKTGEAIKFAVAVTNTSKRDGKEVVQVYAHDRFASVTRPEKLLIGFKKVDIGAGKTVTVDFDIDSNVLAFTGVDKKRVLEPGAVDLWVGASSDNIKLKQMITLAP